MSVTAAILGQVDRIAAGRTLAQSNYSTGDNFWQRVDAADNETYENRVKGADMTALDAALATAAVWGTAALRSWFVLHQSYIIQDLGLAAPYFATFFDSIKSRVPWGFAQSLVEALGVGSALAPTWVFPPGIRPANGSDPANSSMHRFGLLTGTAGDPTWEPGAAPPAGMGPAGILLTNETATPGPSALKLTCTHTDETDVDLTVTLASTGQHDQTILGAVAIDAAGAAAAQPTIPIAGGSTAMFKAGCPVLIYKSDAVQEIGFVDSITANTSITLADGLTNAYASADLVIPLYVAVAWKSGTITSGKKLSVYGLPDRTISL